VKNQIARAHICNYTELFLDCWAAIAVDNPDLANSVADVRHIPETIELESGTNKGYAVLAKLLYSFINRYIFTELSEEEEYDLSKYLPTTTEVLTRKWSLRFNSGIEKTCVCWRRGHGISVHKQSKPLLYVGPAVWMNFGAAYGYAMPHICASILGGDRYPFELCVFTIEKELSTFSEFTTILENIPGIRLISLLEKIDNKTLIDYLRAGGTDEAFELPLFYLNGKIGLKSHISYHSFTNRKINVTQGLLSIQDRLNQQEMYGRMCHNIKALVKEKFDMPVDFSKLVNNRRGDSTNDKKIILIANRDEAWVGNGQTERNSPINNYLPLIKSLTESGKYIVVRINTVGQRLEYEHDNFYDLSGLGLSTGEQAHIVSFGDICIGASTGATDFPRLLFGIPSIIVDCNVCLNYFLTIATMHSPKKIRIVDVDKLQSCSRQELAECIFKKAWNNQLLSHFGLIIDNLDSMEILNDAKEYMDFILKGKTNTGMANTRTLVQMIDPFAIIDRYPETLLSTRAVSNIQSIAAIYTQ